ncbi:uncharacterized protein M6B38_155545 [Iris pallida]|uniref:DUF4408 domain-containing protein n=1 Tax=Iris pallida TaxID=29817 RepID=A0AAX6F4P9_IRIPA|nr:uncharacterized protein M6B38_155545 [Iris pallida]
MERIVIMKSQVAKTFLLLSFLVLTPFISAPLRSSYLYFLFNLLVILLALDAGLLASISKPHDDIKKPPPSSSSSSSSTQKLNELDMTISTQEAVTMAVRRPLQKQRLLLQAEKPKKKVVAPPERVQMLKRCRSKPSIFFIGSCDLDEEEDRQQQEAVQVEEKVAAAAAAAERVGDLMSKQELFMKAETFIGNFYKQLKMQRQDQSEHSWALS